MVWIAMDRLQGQTLREILHRAGQLNVADALYYASEIADGVAAVHEVNVVHRDLKPENVFVTSRNHVKVLDLGTGKFTGYGLETTDRLRVIGTTAYMSPEQIKGLTVDGRADVYALGLITYEMLAGQHPFSMSGRTSGLPEEIERLAIMQLQTTPPSLAQVAPEIPDYVVFVVERAIRKRREDRHPSMAAFSSELRAARKRFVAENRLEASSADLRLARDLREKFGAPPRKSSNPVPKAASFSRVPQSEAPDLSVTSRSTSSGPPSSSPATPRDPVGLAGISPHEPTLDISNFSMPGLMAEGDKTDRVLPPDDVRMRTTSTNPWGFRRNRAFVDEHEPKSRSFGPKVRRLAVTLGLGALIGVPPAVIGVLWSARRAPPSNSPSALELAPEVGQPNASRESAHPVTPTSLSTKAFDGSAAVDAPSDTAVAKDP
jgi:serine/threonine protein kinase